MEFNNRPVDVTSASSNVTVNLDETYRNLPGR